MTRKRAGGASGFECRSDARTAYGTAQGQAQLARPFLVSAVMPVPNSRPADLLGPWYAIAGDRSSGRARTSNSPFAGVDVGLVLCRRGPQRFGRREARLGAISRSLRWFKATPAWKALAQSLLGGFSLIRYGPSNAGLAGLPDGLLFRAAISGPPQREDLADAHPGRT